MAGKVYKETLGNFLGQACDVSYINYKEMSSALL